MFYWAEGRHMRHHLCVRNSRQVSRAILLGFSALIPFRLEGVYLTGRGWMSKTGGSLAIHLNYRFFFVPRSPLLLLPQLFTTRVFLPATCSFFFSWILRTFFFLVFSIKKQQRGKKGLPVSGAEKIWFTTIPLSFPPTWWWSRNRNEVRYYSCYPEGGGGGFLKGDGQVFVGWNLSVSAAQDWCNRFFFFFLLKNGDMDRWLRMLFLFWLLVR